MDIFNHLAQNGVKLNPQQHQAMIQTDGMTLLLAVPGSGKTTVLVSRIANLILNESVRPEEILTITFSRDSAADMTRRFGNLFGAHIPIHPHFSTIHSFCYGVLKVYSRDRGRQIPTLLEGGDAPVGKLRLLRECYLSENGEYPDEETVAEIERLCSYFVNMMIKPGREEAAKYNIPNLHNIYSAFQKRKREQDLMDYDDLLTYARSIFRTRPDILQRYQLQVRYLCVDEAQDTSRIQHAILEMLCARNQNLFLVGDEDQSIYSFRGAYPQGLLDFGKRHPEARILKLEENYRSTKPIVEHANRIISHNHLRYEKTMFTNRGDGPELKIKTLDNGYNLNEYLYSRLEKLPKGKTAAILYRNNPSAIAILDHLSRKGVEYYIKDHPSKLKKQSITQDILSIITLHYSPDDLTAFGRIYYKMGAYISRRMYEYAQQNTLKGDTVYQVVACAPEDNLNSARIRMLQYTTARFGRMTPEKVLNAILYDFDYLGYLQGCSENGFYFELCTQKLRALEYIARTTGTLEEFLGRIEEVDALITQASTRSGAPITLSTIHSVKGLEFDQVYLIDLQEGILPSSVAISRGIAKDPELLEEERRLFYVGITRAREELEVISCERLGDTRLSPSRFLTELTRLTPQEEAQGVEIGRELQHRYFGRGSIVAVDFKRSLVDVRFAKQGNKTLLMSVLSDETLVRLL